MSEETPSVVLVVANETLAGGELVTAVERRAENGPIQAIVIAPVNEPSAGYVVYENTRRQTAGRRLDAAVRSLQAAGVPARGDVFEGGPLAAVKDVLAQEHVDELIVSTHPQAKSGWLRRNLIDEIVKVAGDRPVAHIVVSEVEKTGTQNVLVVANETVLGAPLLDRIKRRAAEGPSGFLLICPQSDPLESAHPEAERRLRAALNELRMAGIEAHGQIAHPDPYSAVMQAVEDERVDEIIVSTFPGEKSGWLRRDLVGRLRSDTKVPVEHVIVDPSLQETSA